jgi:hypothetical protein
MVQHKSELSISRTGIHGGIRRGAAAAAIGAVLVLTTGAPASQAEEGTPDPRDSAAPAVDTKSLPVVASPAGQSAREDAPGQNRDKNPNAGGNGKPGARPGVSASASASAVPSALLPVITATQSPGSRPAPTATPSPVPTTGAPAPGRPTATRPATSPAGSAPASPGTPSASTAQPTAPASSPTGSPAAGSEVGGTPTAGTPTAGGATGQGPASQDPPAGSAGTTATRPGPGSDAVQLRGNAKGQPRTQASAATAPGAAAAGHASYVPIYAVAQANSGWTPSYSAGALGNSVRSSAELNAQPEPKSALVWLGSGLVGVAGAAGLVFFRLRNP